MHAFAMVICTYILHSTIQVFDEVARLHIQYDPWNFTREWVQAANRSDCIVSSWHNGSLAHPVTTRKEKHVLQIVYAANSILKSMPYYESRMRALVHTTFHIFTPAFSDSYSTPRPRQRPPCGDHAVQYNWRAGQMAALAPLQWPTRHGPSYFDLSGGANDLTRPGG